MHVRRSGATESGGGGCFCAFFAVKAVVGVVERLAGGLGDGVRGECAVFGCGAGREGFGGEFGGGVVADFDAGFVLWGGDVSLDDWMDGWVGRGLLLWL